MIWEKLIRNMLKYNYMIFNHHVAFGNEVKESSGEKWLFVNDGMTEYYTWKGDLWQREEGKGGRDRWGVMNGGEGEMWENITWISRRKNQIPIWRCKTIKFLEDGSIGDI